MKMIICSKKKHYYDAEKFRGCPYCSSSANDDDTPTLSLNSYDDDTPTISMAENDVVFFPVDHASENPPEIGEDDTPTVSLKPNEEEKYKTDTDPDPGKTIELDEEPGFWPVSGQDSGVTVQINEECNLTAGWLVCVEGVSKGRDYRIVSGNNMVGREYSMPICIQGDDTISRENHCAVIYDDKHNRFYIMPKNNTVSMNGELLEKPVELKTGDEFSIGNSRFVFIAFCVGDRKW